MDLLTYLLTPQLVHFSVRPLHPCTAAVLTVLRLYSLSRAAVAVAGRRVKDAV